MKSRSKQANPAKPAPNHASTAEHLAEDFRELSELEYALTLVSSAYQRWMVRCMTTAGMPQLSAMEILILHFVRSHNKPKTFVDIMLVRDIDETHLVTYAVRKLERLNLVSTKRAGKEKLVAITPTGIQLCAKYKEIRKALLVGIAKSVDPADLTKVAAILQTLSGFYSQATRTAATM